jgi:hypothetical protein
MQPDRADIPPTRVAEPVDNSPSELSTGIRGGWCGTRAMRHRRIMTQSNQTQHGQSPDASEEIKVTLRGPGELADALPYLMGFHPNDSVVLVALHGE